MARRNKKQNKQNKKQNFARQYKRQLARIGHPKETSIIDPLAIKELSEVYNEYEMATRRLEEKYTPLLESSYGPTKRMCGRHFE